MERILQNEKVRLVIRIAVIVAGVYFVFKYVLPLVWPIVIGYIIAKIITPVVDFMNKKANFHRNIALVLSLMVFVIIIVLAGFYVGKVFVHQLKNLAGNWNGIVSDMDIQVKAMCCGMEKRLDLDRGIMYGIVSDGFYSCLEKGREKIVAVLMDNSLPTFIRMLEIFAEIFIAVLSAFFFVRDKKDINKWVKTYPFAAETKFIMDKLKFVFKAYIRAQLIIMVGTCTVCFLGLSFIKNPYSLLLSLIVGALDALPLIGIGVILIPWALVCVFAGNIKNAIVLIITFVICYILREILEPRLIGGKVGIPPLTSIITIYAGYNLFGLVGVVLGPVAYVTIKESLKWGN